LKAERKAQPKAAHKRVTNSSAVPTESNITSLLAARLFKLIDSLETIVTPSTWPAATARAGERSGARSTPDERTPRTPAARAAEEPSSGNIVGIFAGPSPTGATRIDHVSRSIPLSRIGMHRWNATAVEDHLRELFR
jgi:hypothetical protein